jgi:hypothetical protein
MYFSFPLFYVLLPTREKNVKRAVSLSMLQQFCVAKNFDVLLSRKQVEERVQGTSRTISTINFDGDAVLKHQNIPQNGVDYSMVIYDHGMRERQVFAMSQ